MSLTKPLANLRTRDKSFVQNTNDKSTLSSEFTVALINFNSCSTLSNTLASLRLQSVQPAQWLFFDHGSTDGSEQVLAKFCREIPNAQYFSDERNNIAFSRKRAVEVAATSYILFVDSDVSLSSTWFETAVELALKNTDYAGFCGPIILRPFSQNLNPVKKMQTHFIGNFSTAQMKASDQDLELTHLPTTACIFSRDKVIAAGNFNPKYKRCGEDLELGERMSRLGEKFLCTPDLQCMHHLSTNSRLQWTMRAFQFGRARMRVGVRERRMLVEPKFWIPLATVIAELLALRFHYLIAFELFYLFSIYLVYCWNEQAFDQADVTALTWATHRAYSWGESLQLVQESKYLFTSICKKIGSAIYSLQTVVVTPLTRRVLRRTDSL